MPVSPPTNGNYCVFGLTHPGIGTILDVGMNTMLAFFY